MKEIPLHQEMVSVTGSVTWISYGSSVIGKNPDPRRQQDEKHAHRYRPEGTAGSGEMAGTTAKEDAVPLSERRPRDGSPDTPTGVERRLRA